jgi:crotonobetaine/carnitine-CoA ligase
VRDQYLSKDVSWCVGEQDTVTAILRRAVSARPNHQFIGFQGGASATYAEFDALSNSMAHGLQALGIKQGDTVGVMLDTNMDCVVTWFAVNKIGAIWVPFNTALKGEFLRHQVVNAGASIVIAESDFAVRFEPIEHNVTDLKGIYTRGEEQGPSLQRIVVNSISQLYLDNTEPLAECNKPGDLSMLIYTSGTTGPSKGCMISHNYNANMARLSRDSAGRGKDDVSWSCLPMFHLNATSTTVLSTALTQGSCYFSARFSLSGFWPSIRESGATIVSVIGQMVPLIAKQDDCEDSKACFSQVRAVMALPFDENLQKIWRSRFGVRIAGANCYGLTEASLVTSLPADEYAKPGSSGRANEYFEAIIVDDEMRPLPIGEAGEVVCRPRQPHIMFEGYWKNPEKTLDAFDGMWMHTGDIGRFDKDGFFYFVDRKKDYLRRGGENISSYEVEVALLEHPAIKEVAVHSVLSELSEDEVKATIVLMEKTQINERDLCAWSLDHLPYYAVPRYIEYRSELPINPLNKVMKYQLRDEGVTEATWDRSKSDLLIIKR